jgi:hypothetical protein
MRLLSSKLSIAVAMLFALTFLIIFLTEKQTVEWYNIDIRWFGYLTLCLGLFLSGFFNWRAYRENRNNGTNLAFALMFFIGGALCTVMVLIRIAVEFFG